MKRFFELADEATSKNMESVITQQEMVADNMRSAIAALKEKEEVAMKLMQDAPTATLAKKAQETLSDIRENIQDVESDFVDVMEKVTEQKVQNIQNQDSRYTREIGNLEYDETKDINFVSQAVGHKNIETTQRYIVNDGQTKKKAVSLLDDIFSR